MAKYTMARARIYGFQLDRWILPTDRVVKLENLTLFYNQRTLNISSHELMRVCNWLSVPENFKSISLDISWRGMDGNMNVVWMEHEDHCSGDPTWIVEI